MQRRTHDAGVQSVVARPNSGVQSVRRAKTQRVEIYIWVFGVKAIFNKLMSVQLIR